MQALVYVGPSRLEWHEHASLTVERPLEAIVRPIASSACDLDHRIIAGQTSFEPPFPIGHEAVAEVLEVGDGVRMVRPGDLVVVPWHISCGLCRACRAGLTARCQAIPGLSGYGVSIAGNHGGLFSEEVRVPFADAMLSLLPPGVDPLAVASASDNLTDAYIAVHKGLIKHPKTPVLVVSSVTSLGLFAVDHAIAAGAASVDYVDASERRRALAQEMGARVHVAIDESLRNRFPVVIGATRDPAQIGEAVRCLAPGGHLSNVAIVFGEIPLSLWDLYLRDATVSGGLPSVSPHVEKVLESARCGHIHPERIVTVHDPSTTLDMLLEPDLKHVMVRARLYAGNG